MTTIIGPDGAEIEFHDDTPPEAIKAAMQKRYGGPSTPDVVSRPASDPTAQREPAQEISSIGDVALQAPQGFNLGLDSIANAPYNIIRAGAGLAGYDMPAARNLISEQVNSGIQPQTAAGRIARTAGEVAGANVIPAAGTYAAAARAAPLVAPTGTMSGIGHSILQNIRANPAAAVRADIASTAGAGLAAGAAREADAGPVGETTAALVGGVTPALMAQAVRSAGRAAGNVGSNIMRTTTGISTDSSTKADAIARIREAMAQDARAAANSTVPGPYAPMAQADYAAALMRRQPVINMDAGGDSVRRLARSAVNQSPEASAMLKPQVAERYMGQTGRIDEALAGPMGAGHPTRFRQILEDAARTSRQPLYERAYTDGAAGIDGNWLEELQRSPALQNAMRDAQVRLDNRRAVAAANGATQGRQPEALGPNGNTLEFWDAAKQSLDDDISRALSREQNGIARELINVRDRLVRGLDESVPSYAAARGRASQIFGTGNALEAGERFASPAARHSNAEVRAALADMTPDEIAAFQEGYTSRLRQQLAEIGDNQNAANRLLNSPATRDRMELALGRDRAAEVADFLMAERRMQAGHQALTGNSSTAMFMKDLGDLQSPLGTHYSPAERPTLWGTLGGNALKNWKMGNVEKAANQRAVEIARVLSSQDPSLLSAAARSQTARPASQRWLSPAMNNATGQAAIQLNRDDDGLIRALKRRTAR